MSRYTLADYRRRTELHGSDLAAKTAASDLDEPELGQPAAYVKHLERTKRRHEHH